MKLSRVLHAARSALRTDKGREVGGRVTDAAADTARRVSPKHRDAIDKAQRHAQKYLDRS